MPISEKNYLPGGGGGTGETAKKGFNWDIFFFQKNNSFDKMIKC